MSLKQKEVVQNMNETKPKVSCSNCRALCCRVEIRLIEDDDFNIDAHLTEQTPSLYTIMKKSSDGWCVALDRKTMLCTIYEERPYLCSEYEVGSYDCMLERQKGALE